jgi:hypothetical protein
MSSKIAGLLQDVKPANHRFAWIKTDLWYGKDRDAITPKLFSKLLVSALCDAIWFVSIFVFFSVFGYLKSKQQVDTVDNRVTTITVAQCEVVFLFGTTTVPSWVLLDKRASAARGVLQTLGQHLFSTSADGTSALLDGSWFAGCQSILAIPSSGANITIILKDSTAIINEQQLVNLSVSFRSPESSSSKLLLTNVTLNQSTIEAYFSNGLIVAESIESLDPVPPALKFQVDFGAVAVQPLPNFLLSAVVSGANLSCISPSFSVRVSESITNESVDYLYSVSDNASRANPLQYFLSCTSQHTNARVSLRLEFWALSKSSVETAFVLYLAKTFCFFIFIF